MIFLRSLSLVLESCDVQRVNKQGCRCTFMTPVTCIGSPTYQPQVYFVQAILTLLVSVSLHSLNFIRIGIKRSFFSFIHVHVSGLWKVICCVMISCYRTWFANHD